MDTLEVWCFGERAGLLTDAAGGLDFAYHAEWIASGRPPLSQSLPLHGEFLSAAVRAFFAGLLPEGEPRRQLARDLGISERNDFALLQALGGDCPGAVSLHPQGNEPEPLGRGEDVEWLDDDGLAGLIAELPTRPMLAETDGEIRLSLAGAQDKLPVVVSTDGRVGVTSGRTPSTHILKTPITRLDGTVANEAFCLRLGKVLGVPVVEAEPRRAGHTECLLVERYDRETAGGETRRLHQEDFCQALGVEPERKYQAEGGPGLTECFDLVKRATTAPARPTLAMLDAVAFNFVVGNNDAHGKNFSLLYGPDAVTLAPFYDILSTVAYNRVHNLTRKTAMKVGGEYRPDRLRDRHWDRFFDEAGLGPGPSRRRLRQLSSAAPSAAREVERQMKSEGWMDDVLRRIVETVEDRADRLSEMLGGAPAVADSPPG